MVKEQIDQKRGLDSGMPGIIKKVTAICPARTSVSESFPCKQEAILETIMQIPWFGKIEFGQMTRTGNQATKGNLPVQRAFENRGDTNPCKGTLTCQNLNLKTIMRPWSIGG
jgi:hypothetical protein